MCGLQCITFDTTDIFTDIPKGKNTAVQSRAGGTELFRVSVQLP